MAPISFLESATGNQYEPSAGRFLDHGGRPQYYTSADRIQSEEFKFLDTGSLLEAAADQALGFVPEEGKGALFSMLGALRTVGKLGMIAVDHSPQAADQRYENTLAALHSIAGPST